MRYYQYYYHITKTPKFSHILNRTSHDVTIVFKGGRTWKTNGKGVNKKERGGKENWKRGEKRPKRWTNQKQIEKRDRKTDEKGERKRMGEK